MEDKKDGEQRLSIDKELRILWKLCLGLEENVKSVKKYVKRVETARYQQKNTQPQTEDCTHSFDLNNRCSRCGVRGVKDMIAELQDTPEEWEERFVKRFGYFSSEIDFIKNLLSEREREVVETIKEIIDVKSIYQENGNECGTPLELIEWYVDTELDKLNK